VWIPNLEGWGNLEGLKIGVKAWEPAGHPPGKVCRSGTPAEAFCVHIKMMVRLRDGTVVHIPVCPTCRRDGTRVFSTAHSNPPGLYVYSQPESRENSGPAVPIAIGSNRGLYLKWSVFAKNAESGENIPVLCTSGYYWNSSATSITGALHLGFQTAVTAISETAAAPRNTLSGNRRIWNEKPAAAPRNICRTGNIPLWMKVQRTETLLENVEHRIMNNESGMKNPLRGRLIPPGLYVYSQPVNRENSGPAVPIAIGSNRGLYLKWSVFAKNAESENNIPVLCTSGYNAVSDSLLLIIYSSNADSPDSYRGEDAVRLPNEATKEDLSACKAPDNVGNKRIGQKDADEVRFDQFNAGSPGSYRGEDAVRLQDKTTKGD
jgi:hypothetical protein